MSLILTIEMDGIGTDGMLEGAEITAEDFGGSIAKALLWDWTETMAREGVYVVFCGVPGEKSMNDDFEVYVRPGRVIGVALKADAE